MKLFQLNDLSNDEFMFLDYSWRPVRVSLSLISSIISSRINIIIASVASQESL